jgi:hypothetical protein
MAPGMTRGTMDTAAMAGTEVMADMVEARLTGIGGSPHMLFPLPILDK